MTDDLLEVGRITKAHGLHGDVIVDLWSDLTDRLDPGSVLETDEGPLCVESSRLYQGRYMVRFGGVEDRTGAEALRGRILKAIARQDPDVLWVHDLIGADVVLVDGTSVGSVESIESNPASDLLVLADGQLVPLTFVVSHEPGVRVVIDPPEGLLA
jgi:16S rRNA processing protein RimM